MNNKTIQELKENFYILYEKYLQEKKEQTGEEVFPTKATLLNLLLNETERYIGGNFDGTRLFTNHEVDILNQAHALLFKLYKDELSPQGLYENLKEFTKNTKDFYDAVYEMNCGEYHRLLDVDKNINTTSYESTPLINAVKNLNLKMVADIIHRGADVNQPDKKGFSPLYHALQGRGVSSGATHSLIVQLLIQAGARQANLDGKGSSALVLAVKNNRPRCLMMLIKTKGDAEGYIKNEKGENVSFLNYAVQRSFYNVFQVLVAKGAQLNKADETGLTPLQTAESLGKTSFKDIIMEFQSIEKASLVEDQTKKWPSIHATPHKIEKIASNQRGGHLQASYRKVNDSYIHE